MTTAADRIGVVQVQSVGRTESGCTVAPNMSRIARMFGSFSIAVRAFCRRSSAAAFCWRAGVSHCGRSDRDLQPHRFAEVALTTPASACPRAPDVRKCSPSASSVSCTLLPCRPTSVQCAASCRDRALQIHAARRCGHPICRRCAAAGRRCRGASARQQRGGNGSDSADRLDDRRRVPRRDARQRQPRRTPACAATPSRIRRAHRAQVPDRDGRRWRSDRTAACLPGVSAAASRRYVSMSSASSSCRSGTACSNASFCSSGGQLGQHFAIVRRALVQLFDAVQHLPRIARRQRIDDGEHLRTIQRAEHRARVCGGQPVRRRRR